MTEKKIVCGLENEWNFHEIEHFHEFYSDQWQIGSNLCVVTLNANNITTKTTNLLHGPFFSATKYAHLNWIDWFCSDSERFSHEFFPRNNDNLAFHVFLLVILFRATKKSTKLRMTLFCRKKMHILRLEKSHFPRKKKTISLNQKNYFCYLTAVFLVGLIVAIKFLVTH